MSAETYWRIAGVVCACWFFFSMFHAVYNDDYIDNEPVLHIVAMLFIGALQSAAWPVACIGWLAVIMATGAKAMKKRREAARTLRAQQERETEALLQREGILS